MSRTSRRGAHRFIFERDAANLVKPRRPHFYCKEQKLKDL
jgi:hypothetical protein